MIPAMRIVNRRPLTTIAGMSLRSHSTAGNHLPAAFSNGEFGMKPDDDSQGMPQDAADA